MSMEQEIQGSVDRVVNVMDPDTNSPVVTLNGVTLLILNTDQPIQMLGRLEYNFDGTEIPLLVHMETLELCLIWNSRCEYPLSL